MTQWGHADPTPVDTPKTGDEKLMVAVRIRPHRPDEGQRVVHAVNEKTVILEDPPPSGSRARARGPSRQYLCDKVFEEDATQEEVYASTTRPLVDAVLRGYNATVFAYGATGAGKTHTMVGPEEADDPSQQGVMVRALNELFGQAAHLGDKVTLSYLEIYNENIRDLLNPSGPTTSGGSLELREDQSGGVRVAGLTEANTRSTAEVLQLLHRGNRARTVEPTAANKASSRSHALLSVRLTRSAAPGRPRALSAPSGRLYMIDLAGSERASNTKNRGKRLQEGAHINRSLLALGNCINALAGGARYVNFRDSKLTRLLKDALTGDTRAVMIAHVSPGEKHGDETRNTLAYAHRAGTITSRAGQYRDIVSDLRAEIARLRAKLAEGELAAVSAPVSPSAAVISMATTSADVGVSTHGGEGGGAALTHLRDDLVATFREQMRLRRTLLDIDAQLLRLDSETDRQQMILSRANKLYQGQAGAPSTAGTTRTSVRGYRDVPRGPGRGAPSTIADTETSDGESASPPGSPMRRALHALESIEHERSRLTDLRAKTERDLERARGEAARLEDGLPLQASSAEERELLSLVLRVHELEAERLALQGERELRRHELRRRDLLLMRYDRQRHICDEIITRQRRLIEDGRLMLPPDLHDLYRLYQKEIHAAAYSAFSPYSAYGLTDAYGSLGSTFTADSTGRGLYTAQPGSDAMDVRTSARTSELPAIRRGERMYRRAPRGHAQHGQGGRDSTSRSSGRSPNSSNGSDWEVATLATLPSVIGAAPTAPGGFAGQRPGRAPEPVITARPLQFPPISIAGHGTLRRAASTDNLPSSAERARRQHDSPPVS
ncbi:kinesin-like protein KIF19 [Frankliniella occidentalis]|uniref:Kinesin-like protein n=1 Tax=Frankliniella occidentalis TaxID=133901 RepID=A0A6J1TMU4_FRAOC|nr:kinesin-like protein KIF19 [Frankliniella occidentalis]